MVEQTIRLDFPAYNNEIEYEAILVRIDLAQSVSFEKLLICSDSQLVVGQVNGEYETRDQCMARGIVSTMGFKPTTRWASDPAHSTHGPLGPQCEVARAHLTY